LVINSIPLIEQSYRNIPKLTKVAINAIGYDELSALIPIMGPSILGRWPKGISHQAPWEIVTF
jgi:hypothetical protein